MPFNQDPVTELDAPALIKAWLAAFTEASRSGSTDGLGSLFGEVFVSADPTGAVAVPKPAFLAALPAREQMFKAAGWADPELETAGYTPIGEHFGVLSTTWRMSALDGGEGSMRLRSSFVLLLRSDRAETIGYLNDQDLRTLLSTGKSAGAAAGASTGAEGS